MAKLEINVSDSDAEFIRSQVEATRFESASELLHVALSIFREDDRDDAAKLERLRRLAKVGFDQLDRGEYIVVPPEDVGTFAQKRLAAMLAERAAATAAKS